MSKKFHIPKRLLVCVVLEITQFTVQSPSGFGSVGCFFCKILVDIHNRCPQWLQTSNDRHELIVDLSGCYEFECNEDSQWPVIG